MDRIGTIMGAVTIPMALLTAASVAAGLWLLVAGQAVPVAIGIAMLAAGLALAWALERIVVLLDGLAIATRVRHGVAAGQAVALCCGIVPMLVLLGWECEVSFRLALPAPPAIAASSWLWAYGVATGPWTLLALLVGSDRRTLCGIRAYAGHLACWLLAAALLAGAPRPLAIAAMALPAILPVTVGTLLAIADREALRNVRI